MFPATNYAHSACLSAAVHGAFASIGAQRASMVTLIRVRAVAEEAPVATQAAATRYHPYAGRAPRATATPVVVADEVTLAPGDRVLVWRPSPPPQPELLDDKTTCPVPGTGEGAKLFEVGAAGAAMHAIPENTLVLVSEGKRFAGALFLAGPKGELLRLNAPPAPAAVSVPEPEVAVTPETTKPADTPVAPSEAKPAAKANRAAPQRANHTTTTVSHNANNKERDANPSMAEAPGRVATP